MGRHKTKPASIYCSACNTAGIGCNCGSCQRLEQPYIAPVSIDWYIIRYTYNREGGYLLYPRLCPGCRESLPAVLAKFCAGLRCEHMHRYPCAMDSWDVACRWRGE